MGPAKLIGAGVGIGLRARFELLSDLQFADQVILLTLFAAEVRLIVSAAAANIDRYVWIHADLAGAGRAGLRCNDVIWLDAVLDPVHECREQRFRVDLGTRTSAAVAVARIREIAVELLRLL
jgi:hypothetical protein